MTKSFLDFPSGIESAGAMLAISLSTSSDEAGEP
jgi:hypothetical protein